ncbi:MAG: enoyl-CoA hydratase-related protein [Steroidobacteraceae bacterium]
MTEGVRVARRGGVLEVTIDRPPVNAIDIPTSKALGAAFATLRDDPDLRVGIITGGGEKIFSAGWDLKALDKGEMSLDRWWDDDYGEGGFAGLTEFWGLNKPVIGALNGKTIGGGFEIALSCDLLVAAEHVQFRLPELPLGLVPDAGALQRLPRRLPRNLAMEMLYLGRWLSAEEAARFGLVNVVVPADRLMAQAREWADQIAAAAPKAVEALKEVTNGIEGLGPRRAYEVMRSGVFPAYERMLGSEDAREGVSAFVDKREARFRDR